MRSVKHFIKLPGDGLTLTTVGLVNLTSLRSGELCSRQQ